MNNFIYENKTKVYFGKGGVKEYLRCLIKNYDTIMLAYGKSSIKKNGVYDEITEILNAAGKNDEKIALAGINALSEFIKEAGLPTNFKELGVDPSLDLKAVANSCVLNSNGCKQLTHEEVYEIFLECKGE